MRSLPVQLLFMLIILAAVLAPMQVSDVEGQTGDMMVMAHYNMKTGDDLSLQIADESASPETRRVEADYDPYHGFQGARANRRWVDVGTWESATKSQGTFHVNGSVTFNLWITEIDEGFGNDCEFEFTLSVDGNTAVTSQTSTVTSPGGPMEVRTTSGQVSFTVTPQTTLTLDIRYNGWEDIDVHWDSYDRDSGFRVNMDPIKIMSFKTGSTSASVKFGDRFGVDWSRSAYVSRIYVNNSEADADFSVVAKGDTSDGNGTIPVYEITWSAISNNQSQPVAIALSYSRIVDPVNQTSWYLEGKASGGGGDDDDDGFFSDNGMVFGGISLLIIILIIIIIIVMRGRKSDEDEETDECETWDDVPVAGLPPEEEGAEYEGSEEADDQSDWAPPEEET